MGLTCLLRCGLATLAACSLLSCAYSTVEDALTSRTSREEDDERATEPDATPTDLPEKDVEDNAEKSAEASESSVREQGDAATKQGQEEEEICDELSLLAKPNAPDILIVLDRSSSMATPIVDRWSPSVSVLKELTDELGEVVNFGLMLFPSLGARAGIAQGILNGLGLGAINVFLPADTGCAPGKLDVPLAARNAEAIARALDTGAPRGFAYTPTSATLTAALSALSSRSCADCGQAPQYVLLVTDGEPTCTTDLPLPSQADVDATNTALDRLRASNIKTYVIGYGTASSPAANSAMESFAQHGGAGSYLPVESGRELNEELRRVVGALVSCEYELNEDVDDPALVRVTIDGQTLVLNEGWHMEGRKVVLEGACDKIRDAKIHTVKLTKSCTPRAIF